MPPPSSPRYAYQLRFSWTGWPRNGERFPETFPESTRTTLTQAWQSDGLRALEWTWNPDAVRILFSIRPEASPVFLCQHAKGRLQHALRERGNPVRFSRKISCVSVGNPNRTTVENYLRNQLDGGDFADSKYREALARLAVTNPEVQPTQPFSTRSGRYVVALHVVLVTADRVRLPSQELQNIRDALIRKPETGRVSVMPDHVHLAVKGDPARSPANLAEEIRQCTGQAAGTQGLWMPTSYVGTFREYGMAAVRKRVRQER
jgi:REP element-mobilizing transposase RayT